MVTYYGSDLCACCINKLQYSYTCKHRTWEALDK